MKPMKARITSLEAQINALAQAWLYLSAHVEMHTGISLERMEEAMCKKHWPANPDIDQEARDTLHWLRAQSEEARENRRMMQRAKAQARTAVTVKVVDVDSFDGMPNVIPMRRFRQSVVQCGSQRPF